MKLWKSKILLFMNFCWQKITRKYEVASNAIQWTVFIKNVHAFFMSSSVTYLTFTVHYSTTGKGSSFHYIKGIFFAMDSLSIIPKCMNLVLLVPQFNCQNLKFV